MTQDKRIWNNCACYVAVITVRVIVTAKQIKIVKKRELHHEGYLRIPRAPTWRTIPPNLDNNGCMTEENRRVDKWTIITG